MQMVDYQRQFDISRQAVSDQLPIAEGHRRPCAVVAPEPISMLKIGHEKNAPVFEWGQHLSDPPGTQSLVLPNKS
jgi:hypothetical protein